MPGERPSIVFVHSSDEQYGADRILLDLLTALPDPWRNGAEVWLPTDVPHGAAPLCVELERRGALVRHLDLPVLRRAYATPSQMFALFNRWHRFRRELRRRRPEVLYCTTSAMLLTTLRAHRGGTSRVVVHVQELWSRRDAMMLGPMARSTDQLIAISEPVRNALPRHLQPRARVVLNATPPPDRVAPLEGRDGPLRFLVASRWNSWKGHRTLLAAWDRVEAPGSLVVLGGPPPSGDSVDVRALVGGLRHPDSVEVVGEVVDVQPWIEGADVVVVPSDSPEPFGLVAIEAFARGRPVIASRGGGLADIITDGEDGWLFPLGDTSALAVLLDRLDRDMVVEAGLRARAAYERRFTARRFVGEWRAATAGASSPLSPGG